MFKRLLYPCLAILAALCLSVAAPRAHATQLLANPTLTAGSGACPSSWNCPGDTGYLGEGPTWTDTWTHSGTPAYETMQTTDKTLGPVVSWPFYQIVAASPSTTTNFSVDTKSLGFDTDGYPYAICYALALDSSHNDILINGVDAQWGITTNTIADSSFVTKSTGSFTTPSNTAYIEAYCRMYDTNGGAEFTNFSLTQ